MDNETTDEIAWRLAWISQWKIQQESCHADQTLSKMIGYLKVYNQATEYMQTHDVSSGVNPEFMPAVDAGSAKALAMREDDDDDDDDQMDNADEFLHLLTNAAKDNPPPKRPEVPRSDSFVVTVTEVETEKAKNPFDDEETSSHGDDDDDDDGWSSDEETEIGSVSSVGDHDASLKCQISAKLSASEKEADAEMESLLSSYKP